MTAVVPIGVLRIYFEVLVEVEVVAVEAVI